MIIVFLVIVSKYIELAILNTIIDNNNIVKAPGRASLITLYKNLPLTGLLLGSLTKNNEGKPIASVSIRNNWFVEIGYVPIITASIARNREKIVFVKNKDETLVTLLITLLPSDTTKGIESKLESNNTKWLQFLAAALPDAISI